MNTLESLLSTAVDRPLISYGRQTETQVSFAQRVEKLVDRLQKISVLHDTTYVLVTEEDPIAFYVLLLALWKNGNRVILPTRDFFTDPNSITYYEYTVSCPETQVHTTANPAFNPVEISDEGDVVAFSSGSTGVPKGILHHHAHFLANASAVSEQIKEGNVNSLTFLKPYLVSALSHLFVHFITDSHLRFEDYENVHTLVNHYEDQRNFGIVGSPMHITSGLQFIPLEATPRFFFSSGDFLSAASSTRILNSFPGTVIYNVYGLAELAGRFFINRIDSTTPTERYETIGNSIDGTRYRLDDGQIFVNADFLFKGYIRGNRYEPAAKWHPSQDLARQGEQGLHLIGRANDEIKILGNKVSLKHVENSIKRVLDRDVAVALASEHPHFGNILSLVLDDCTGLSRSGLIRQLRTQLKPYEIPHQFFIMDDIPFTQSMKIDRAAIADRLDSLRAIE
jgi:acyl-CoA synthetase (AMP-forming)/AMP-acid ligase II